jgi:hypothetical protein
MTAAERAELERLADDQERLLGLVEQLLPLIGRALDPTFELPPTSVGRQHPAGRGRHLRLVPPPTGGRARPGGGVG